MLLFDAAALGLGDLGLRTWVLEKIETTFDSRAFRRAVGQFVTGVTVIAIELDGEIRAMTANSFTSLSLEPPLVLFCPGKQTKAPRLIQTARAFSVNILTEEQQPLSTYFAGAWKDEAPPPFSFTAWHQGAPRLDGSTVALSCVTQAVHEGGDHCRSRRHAVQSPTVRVVGQCDPQAGVRRIGTARGGAEQSE